MPIPIKHYYKLSLNMSLRAIQEFVVHLESFRNIDLWYQGAYLLCLQIYMEVGPEKQREVLHLS